VSESPNVGVLKECPTFTSNLNLNMYTIVAGLVFLFKIYRWVSEHKGTMKITTDSVAYQPNDRLSWDRYSLILNGHRILLFSGEFHYWRIPDSSSWESILRLYQNAGLNCIRIYFHWGYHCPGIPFIF
jgi:hypothetical protein